MEKLKESVHAYELEMADQREAVKQARLHSVEEDRRVLQERFIEERCLLQASNAWVGAVKLVDYLKQEGYTDAELLMPEKEQHPFSLYISWNVDPHESGSGDEIRRYFQITPRLETGYLDFYGGKHIRLSKDECGQVGENGLTRLEEVMLDLYKHSALSTKAQLYQRGLAKISVFLIDNESPSTPQ